MTDKTKSRDASASKNILIFTVASWGDWGDWSQCSKTCGGGTSERERECKLRVKDDDDEEDDDEDDNDNDVSPEIFQTSCPGDRTKTRDCNKDKCTGNKVKNIQFQWSEKNEKDLNARANY